VSLDRFHQLASRALIAAVVLSKGSEVKLYFLDAGDPDTAGWYFAGIVALTATGLECETAEGFACAMERGRALFVSVMEVQQVGVMH
jgi:hypothetical protein